MNHTKKAESLLQILYRDPDADREALEATQHLDDSTVAIMAVAHAIMDAARTADNVLDAIRSIEQRM